jgi:hypothetical protein
VSDSERQLGLKLIARLGSGNGPALFSVRVGGLRSGWASFAAGKLSLHSYSYVPGMTVSGQITSTRVTLRVGGTAAAHGTLLAEPEASGTRARLSGQLEGHEVSVQSAGPSASAMQANVADLRSVIRAAAR